MEQNLPGPSHNVCMYIHFNFLIMYFNSLVLCKDGDVRLLGGQSAYEGRVEVCLSQRWGTVTDSEWSAEDAQVVCR